jgi:formyl-CoA transferase
MVVDVAHQTLGTIPIVNRPFKFPGRDMPTPEAPPVLGQHTDTILSEIVGLNAEQIAKLKALKIIA